MGCDQAQTAQTALHGLRDGLMHVLKCCSAGLAEQPPNCLRSLHALLAHFSNRKQGLHDCVASIPWPRICVPPAHGHHALGRTQIACIIQISWLPSVQVPESNLEVVLLGGLQHSSAALGRAHATDALARLPCRSKMLLL